MNRYKVGVGGDNFIIHIEGKKRRINLVKMYYLAAENKESAEHQSLGELKKELENLVLNDINDPPEMYIQSVEEVKKIPPNQPNEFYWSEIDDNKN